jgi:outer membrane protein OmpA-like peptidoglycan-associated protein
VGEGFMLRPVEISGDEGADSVVFLVAQGSRARAATDSLASWTVEVTDDSGANGVSARRFGPFFSDKRGRATVPASLLLAGRAQARYAAVVTANFVKRAQDGSNGPSGAPSATVRRELSFDLARKGTGIEETSRFAILFDIDAARTVSAYDLFLARVVTPRIRDGATVFIRGRTDVVTDAAYNLRLSKGRAEGVLRSLEAATYRVGKRHVSFKPSWTGEDPAQAPFGNALPEERNHNRTVIIDILPE